MANETGYTICRKGDKLIKGCESIGDSHRHISLKICCNNGGKPVGTFHTHPDGSVDPSPQDIAEMRRLGMEFMCIEVPETREAKCYRLVNRK